PIIYEWGPGFFVDQNLAAIPVGDNVRMVDANIYLKFADHFEAVHQDRSFPGWPYTMRTDISWPTSFSLYDRVTIIGVSGEYENGDQYITPDRVYLGGSQYGAMSLGPGPMAASDDGTAGGGPFRPWPYPTADEILASDCFQERYNREGAIGWALSQPDGAVVDLPGEMVISESEDGLMFGLKETFEPIQHGPRLTLILNRAVHGLRRMLPTIDIVGGTLTTLSDGRRAIINATAVYAHTDASGRYYIMGPSRKPGDRGYVDDPLRRWPWRVQVAP
ncbi:MAG: hypothetical protein Q7T82_11915, partial [Armatimonadota bacterium]|nr:hypothetical protein [Armatimonadota bacterium]